MSQEKKPRKVTGKKDVTKKSAGTPAFKATAMPAAAASITPNAPKPKPRAKAKSLQVSIEDVIRLRAYEIYLQRGATPGNPHEDWDVAEREVRAHYGQEADA